MPVDIISAAVELKLANRLAVMADMPTVARPASMGRKMKLPTKSEFDQSAPPPPLVSLRNLLVTPSYLGQVTERVPGWQPARWKRSR